MNMQPKETPFLSEGPQPLVRPISPGSDYPKTALGPLLEAVSAVQGMTLAPLAIPAQSALAVASLAVQGFADVETLSGGYSPLSLYALTIAQSGERKSSCDAPLMAALRDHERKQAKVLCEEITQWQNANELFEGERKRILSEVIRGRGEKKVAAQADLQALGGGPAKPPNSDRTVTEPTFEGLTRLFVEGQPSLGLFSDEGGQFIGGHAMNSDNRLKTLAALNDLWQGSAIRRTRGGDGAYTLFGRRLAVHLMVQPEAARALMADNLASGTGFLPRFLITAPSSTIGKRLSNLVRRDDAALASFSDRLRSILETPMPIDPETRELTPRKLQLSADARAQLLTFSDTVELEQQRSGSLAHVTGYASKAAEQAVRIAAVLTLWSDLQAREVPSQEMDWGIKLAQFYLSEAVRLADDATVSAETSQAEALRCWLLDTWPGQARKIGRSTATIMAKDVVQYGPNSMRETRTVRKLMAILVDCGCLTQLQEGEIVDGTPRKKAYLIASMGPQIAMSTHARL